jgi:hypothetical protein
MGNFVMGLSACAKACTPCALSSAFLMGFDFKPNPPLSFPRELAFHVKSEFSRQIAVDFGSDADFHKRWS